jgi:hypothetical protein
MRSMHVQLRAALAVLCLTTLAYADRVVVLKADHVLKAQLESGIRALGHENAVDVDKARATAQDGEPDSSGEYVAAGKSVGAAWTLAAQRNVQGRVEVTACQVASGRIEVLARDIVGTNQDAQVQEMLARLLRAEGIGSEEVIWRVSPVGVPSQPASPNAGATVSTSNAFTKAEPASPPSTAYGANAALALGAGVGVFGAIARPGNARGSSLSGTVELNAGYIFIPNLEGRLNVGFSVFGPSAFHADVGARYMFPIMRNLFAGPELTVGLFRPLGGDQTSRFLARPAGVVAIALHPRFQLDVLGEFLVAPGGTGTLVLGGGTLRGNLRL